MWRKYRNVPRSYPFKIEKGLLDRILIVRNNIYKMCGHSPFFDFSKEVKIKEMRLVLFE